MPWDKKIRTIDKNTLKQYIDAQAGINPNYSTKDQFGVYARVIEKQSAEFLEDYISGDVKLERGSEEMMPAYFDILAHSKYDRIRKSLKKAKDQYKLQAILRHKEEEKKNAFLASRFKVLNNKKEAVRLSSGDMLMIAELLEQDLGYSTKILKDKLRSFAENKIEKTFKGEMEADEDFIRLAQTLGTSKQRQTILNRVNKGKSISGFVLQSNGRKPVDKRLEQPAEVLSLASHTSEPKAKKEKQAKKTGFLAKMKKRSKSFGKKAVKTLKRVAIAAGLTLLAYVGGKSVFDKSDKADNERKQDKIEMTQKILDNKTEQTKKQVQTIDLAEEMGRLNKAYKDRFDSSLKILLGASERDKLYEEIDALASQGKIEFSDGTTREWYAHAFTMYDKLCPNSHENKVIKELRRGQDVDKGYINGLVIAAKRDGSGISATGSYSSFDNASKEDQISHIQKRQEVKHAEAALMAAKAAKSR